MKREEAIAIFRKLYLQRLEEAGSAWNGET